MKVLVTGAAGFVGQGLLRTLRNRKSITVTPSVRRQRDLPDPFGGEDLIALDVDPDTDWGSALVGKDVVIHLAARVHRMNDTASDPLAAFRRVNTLGTLALARQASSAGVRRFVFLSTVKVHGEEGGFRETDPPNPRDPYAISKHEAEVGLREVSARTEMEVVIIRPPLVYGPGVKANFRTLMKWVDRGIPLPLGSIRNRRSFVALDNLLDFVTVCAEHPAAAGETFLVRDPEDLSTPELVRRMARILGRRPRLFPVPVPLLVGGATLLGKREAAQRLVGSLYVDSAKANRVLDWKPPVDVDRGLRRALDGLA